MSPSELTKEMGDIWGCLREHFPTAKVECRQGEFGGVQLRLFFPSEQKGCSWALSEDDIGDWPRAIGYMIGATEALLRP